MNNAQLTRYSRHILLPEIDLAGQEKLLRARVAVVGLGGLGSPVALYLAASGVGRLTLCDDDVVDLGNLQRQILHRDAALGRPKVESALENLFGLNAEVAVDLVAERMAGPLLEDIVKHVDVVVDCSDNFPTRYALNAACRRHATPLVFGAALRDQGQITVFDARRATSPCYACLFHEEDTAPTARCGDSGILAPLVGVVGSMQALETLKLLLEMETTLVGRLLRVSGWTMRIQETRVIRDPACAVCGTTPQREQAPTPQASQG